MSSDVIAKMTENRDTYASDFGVVVAASSVAINFEEDRAGPAAFVLHLAASSGKGPGRRSARVTRGALVKSASSA